MAVDVYRALELKHVAATVRKLDTDEKCVQIIHTLGGNQEMTVINESGLYSLILTTRKPAAKAFKKRVTGTVLPATRKDDAYIMGEEKDASGEMDEDEFVLKAMTILQGKVEHFKQEKAKQAQVITEMSWYLKPIPWGAERHLCVLATLPANFIKYSSAALY